MALFRHKRIFHLLCLTTVALLFLSVALLFHQHHQIAPENETLVLSYSRLRERADILPGKDAISSPLAVESRHRDLPKDTHSESLLENELGIRSNDQSPFQSLSSRKAHDATAVARLAIARGLRSYNESYNNGHQYLQTLCQKLTAKYPWGYKEHKAPQKRGPNYQLPQSRSYRMNEGDSSPGISAVPRLFWGILFNHEFVNLEILLHEIYPLIESFVVVEANMTQTGTTKPLYFLRLLRCGQYIDDNLHAIIAALGGTDTGTGTDADTDTGMERHAIDSALSRVCNFGLGLGLGLGLGGGKGEGEFDGDEEGVFAIEDRTVFEQGGSRNTGEATGEATGGTASRGWYRVDYAYWWLRLRQYLPKVRHIAVYETHDVLRHGEWGPNIARENDHRSLILEGWERDGLLHSDLLVMSDVDEVWSREFLIGLKHCRNMRKSDDGQSFDRLVGKYFSQPGQRSQSRAGLSPPHLHPHPPVDDLGAGGAAASAAAAAAAPPSLAPFLSPDFLSYYRKVCSATFARSYGWVRFYTSFIDCPQRKLYYRPDVLPAFCVLPPLWGKGQGQGQALNATGGAGVGIVGGPASVGVLWGQDKDSESGGSSGVALNGAGYDSNGFALDLIGQLRGRYYSYCSDRLISGGTSYSKRRSKSSSSSSSYSHRYTSIRCLIFDDAYTYADKGSPPPPPPPPPPLPSSPPPPLFDPSSWWGYKDNFRTSLRGHPFNGVVGWHLRHLYPPSLVVQKYHTYGHPDHRYDVAQLVGDVRERCGNATLFSPLLPNYLFKYRHHGECKQEGETGCVKKGSAEEQGKGEKGENSMGVASKAGAKGEEKEKATTGVLSQAYASAGLLRLLQRRIRAYLLRRQHRHQRRLEGEGGGRFGLMRAWRGDICNISDFAATEKIPFSSPSPPSPPSTATGTTTTTKMESSSSSLYVSSFSLVDRFAELCRELELYLPLSYTHTSLLSTTGEHSQVGPSTSVGDSGGHFVSGLPLLIQREPIRFKHFFLSPFQTDPGRSRGRSRSSSSSSSHVTDEMAVEREIRLKTLQWMYKQSPLLDSEEMFEFLFPNGPNSATKGQFGQYLAMEAKILETLLDMLQVVLADRGGSNTTSTSTSTSSAAIRKWSERFGAYLAYDPPYEENKIKWTSTESALLSHPVGYFDNQIDYTRIAVFATGGTTIPPR